ncbi:DUF2711 family protein [Bernardetia sp. OM2101]|uniref:DUF2711 family protein n=1 Tax=Bernardetia sp. OM2101 TaxID=3344876 RepID=UPI0035D083FE
MKIIDDRKIYPKEDTPILEHYKECFDAVKICFLPFFQIETNSKTLSRRGKDKITLEELKETDKIFENIKSDNIEIYESNKNYPTDEEILAYGKVIKWNNLIDNTELHDYKEINRSLKTSIGSYKKRLERLELLNNLEEYTEKNELWLPVEGAFDVFTKIGIFNLLKKLGKNEIIVIDELYENERTLNIKNITKKEFINKITFKDYYIYSKDNSILFAISWDDFFYFTVTKTEYIEQVDKIEEFEGFWADENDTHLWDWEKGEIERLLNISQK